MSKTITDEIIITCCNCSDDLSCELKIESVCYKYIYYNKHKHKRSKS